MAWTLESVRADPEPHAIADGPAVLRGPGASERPARALPRWPDARIILGLFCALYATVLIGSFLSPYDAEQQNREAAFAPPTELHVIGADGRIHRPFVY